MHKLTLSQAEAITQISKGADVRDFDLACTLRHLSNATGEVFIQIRQPKHHDVQSEDVAPYFWCEATGYGRKAAQLRLAEEPLPK